MSFASGVVSALDALNGTFGEVQASTGGPQRPPQGRWPSRVKSFKVETEGQTMRLGKGDGAQEIPAIKITFGYQVFGGATGAVGGGIPPQFKEGQDWPGKVFLLPAGGLSAIPDTKEFKGKRQQIEIQLKRLKGHVSVLLGDRFTGQIGPDSVALNTLINGSDSVVLALVECQYQPNEDNPDQPYFEEFINRRLA